MLRDETRTYKLYGYEILGHVIYSIDNRIILNLTKEKFTRVQLRPTMSNFLTYILRNADKEFISDDEVISEVWEGNNLRGSTNRLWQVSRDLHYKLLDAGIENSIYKRTKRKGFVVCRESIVPIFQKVQ